MPAENLAALSFLPSYGSSSHSCTHQKCWWNAHKCSHGTITYHWAEFLVMKIVVWQDKMFKKKCFQLSCGSAACALLHRYKLFPSSCLYRFCVEEVKMKWDCTMRTRTALPLNNIGLPHYEPYLWLISHTKVKCVAHSFLMYSRSDRCHPMHARHTWSLSCIPGTTGAVLRW